MDIRCQECNKVRELDYFRIIDGKRICLCCHTGMPEELAEDFLKCGKAIMASADKIWEQILA